MIVRRLRTIEKKFIRKGKREMPPIPQNAAFVLIDVQNVWDIPKGPLQ